MGIALLQRRIYHWLDGYGGSGAVTFAVSTIFVIAIVACVAAGMAVTVHELSPDGRTLAVSTIAVTQLLFVAEYILRIFSAPARDAKHWASHTRSRLEYLRSPMGIIDLVALTPGLLLVTGAEPWFDDVAALFVLLKLARYNPALGLLGTVIRNERKPLTAALVSVFILMVLAAGIVYLIERDAQPKAFSSVPASMWWAITTMATVGYGDMTPITPLGRMFGGFIMLLGIATFALPAGIMGSGFVTELQRRDQQNSWKTVARLPLFSDLEAVRIASIARLLQHEFVPKGHVIVQKGAKAVAMYFVTAGTVEVDVEPKPVRLGPGSHFGEIALLRDVLRTATVTSVTDCKLLSLSVADFRALMEEQPELRTKLEDTTAARSATPPR